MPLRWAIRGCGNISNDFVHALKVSEKQHTVSEYFIKRYTPTLPKFSFVNN